jgi:hypothetical protein
MKVSTGKLLLALAASVTLAGCATIGPPQPPSLELPKPPSDLRASRKGDKVTLTWTIPNVTTDRQTVRGLGPTRICRGVEPVLNSCGTSAGELAPGASTTRKSPGQKIMNNYTDLLSAQLKSEDPSAFATYAIEVLNSSGRGAGLSNQVRVPVLQAPPAPGGFRAALSNQGIALTWNGNLLPFIPPYPVRNLYRVYRRPEDSQQQVLVGQLQVGTESSSSLLDQSFEWEKTYYYRATVLTVIAQPGKPDIQFEGGDTPEIKVFAHDMFPPAVPSGLQAVFSGPGQQLFIDLIWAPVADIDLAGYNVYRREAGAEVEKLNAELMKTPAYRDQNVSSGKTYFYSVSAVDVRGNESSRSEEASETVP